MIGQGLHKCILYAPISTITVTKYIVPIHMYRKHTSTCPVLMFEIVPLYRDDTSLSIKEKDTLTASDMQIMLGKVKKSLKNDLKGLRQ